MNNVIKGLCAASVLTLSANVAAGPYVVFSIGGSDIESDFTDAITQPATVSPGNSALTVPEVDSFTASDGDTYYSIGGGFDMNEYLAFEFVLNQYGTVEDEIEPGMGFKTKVRSFNIAAVGKYPIADKFILFAKGGLDAWSANFRFKELQAGAWPGDPDERDAGDNDRGYSIMLAFGAAYQVTERLSALLEYSYRPYSAEYKYFVDDQINDPYYKTSDIDLTVSTASIGLNWAF